MEYRLNKTSDSINNFIADYAKERGILPDNTPTKNYPYYLILNDGRIVCCNKHHLSTPIGIDDFLSKIDELAKPKLTINGHKVRFHKEHVEVGCENILNNEVKAFIKEFTKHNDAIGEY